MLTPASYTVTMCGWLRRAAARASSRKSCAGRERASLPGRCGKVLMATTRDSIGSCAAQTVPMPPAPMRSVST